MPMQWVPPKLFLWHKRVFVYHTYRHDVITDPKTYWFTLDSVGDGNSHFDVRDLRAWQEQTKVYLESKDVPYDHAEQIRQVLRMAIDSGELQPKDTHLSLHAAIPETEYNSGIPTNIDCLLGIRFEYYDTSTVIRGDELPVDGTNIEDWYGEDGDDHSARYGTVIAETTLLPAFGGHQKMSGIQYEIDMVGVSGLLSSIPEIDLPKLAGKVCGDEPAGYIVLAFNYRTWTDYNGEYDSEPVFLGVFDFRNLKIIPMDDFL